MKELRLEFTELKRDHKFLERLKNVARNHMSDDVKAAAKIVFNALLSGTNYETRKLELRDKLLKIVVAQSDNQAINLLAKMNKWFPFGLKP